MTFLGVIREGRGFLGRIGGCHAVDALSPFSELDAVEDDDDDDSLLPAEGLEAPPVVGCVEDCASTAEAVVDTDSAAADTFVSEQSCMDSSDNGGRAGVAILQVSLKYLGRTHSIYL